MREYLICGIYEPFSDIAKSASIHAKTLVMYNRPDSGSVLFSTGRMDVVDADGFVEIPLPTYGSEEIRAMKEMQNDENPPPE